MARDRIFEVADKSMDPGGVLALAVLYADDREQIIEEVLRRLRNTNLESEASARDVLSALDDPEVLDAVGKKLSSRMIQTRGLHVVQDESPLGVELSLPIDGHVRCIEVFPNRGTYTIQGVRSFNDAGTVQIDRVTKGNGSPANMSPFDSASYSLDHGAFKNGPIEAHLAYYPAPWGSIDRLHPLGIWARARGTFSCPPPVRWTLYGRASCSVFDPVTREV